jgi:NAD(P)H-flavin reductase
VATGTGIAPFIAFVRAGTRPMLLLHGAHSSEEFLYRDELSVSAEAYVPCLSTPSSTTGADPDVYAGRVTTYLADRLPKALYDFYLCGRSDMIREVTLLVDQRFPGSNVFSEMFY